MSYTVERIEWDDEASAHIRNRSARYPGATNVEPSWTAEAVNDPDRLRDEPDHRSTHPNSVRIVGYSPAARMVITVVALRRADGVLQGVSAWKTRGAPLRQYRNQKPGTVMGAGSVADMTEDGLRSYRDEAEATRDEPLSGKASRPGRQRAKVLSVRLNPGEFDELARYASQLDVPASALVRGWILEHLRPEPEMSPAAAAARIAREAEDLRRRLAS